MLSTATVRRIRFGAFEVDLRSSELFKHGIRIRLQDQPFQILTLLLDHPGELVSREELQRKLWTSDTFVDFDAGLNAAIRRLRDALSESAEEPRYIETLPRHGYRFIAKTEKVFDEVDSSMSEVSTPIGPTVASDSLGDVRSLVPNATEPASGRRGSYWLPILAITGILILVGAVSSVSWRHRVFRTHASPRIQSIAVLPLENLSGDPSQEYFVDGMTDALITDLAQVNSLKVISRTSVMRYKNSREPLSKIAQDLNVDAVVEGSVVRAGNRVRINAQLVAAPADRHIWASAFERDMTDVLTLQDEAASSIATEIAASLTPNERIQLSDARTVKPEAYEDYLKAEYFYDKETDDGFRKAIEYYQKSIALDPDFAPAYVGLAEDYGFMAYTRRADPAEAWDKAESLLAKAVELDPNSSSAHVLVGMIKLQYRCDRSGAEKEIQRALELNSGDMSAVDYHSYYLLEVGRSDEAIAEKKRVLEHDPVSVGTSSELGLYFIEAGRNDEAIEQLKKTLELDPNFPPAHTRLGRAYANKGQFEQAALELKKAIALDKTPVRLGILGETYARSGKVRESLGVIGELKEMSKHRYASPTLIAAIYARLGNKNQALTWLGKAKRKDQPGTDAPAFDGLRSDARFKVLEARLKPEQSCVSF